MASGNKIFLTLFLTISSLLGCVTGDEGEVEPLPDSPQIHPSKLKGAPGKFIHPKIEGYIVPMDIQSIAVNLQIDATDEKIYGLANIKFRQEDFGKPYFDFDGEITSIKIDGKQYDPTTIKTINDPHEVSTLAVLELPLQKGRRYTMELGFIPKPRPSIRVSNDDIDVFFLYNDFDAKKGNGFLGRYFPANLEFDQYKIRTRIQVVGFEGSPLKLYSNGKTTNQAANLWSTQFPSHFNSTAPYIHLTSKSFAELTETYRGRKKAVPITIYGVDEAPLKAAMKTATQTLKKAEKLLGPYPHRALTIRLHNKPYGIEYAGATLSHPKAVVHEILHSWVGRNSFPDSGNSAWFDEAVVLWLEREYLGAKRPQNDLPAEVNFATGKPFSRMTEHKVYKYGPALIDEFIDESDKEKFLTFVKNFCWRSRELVYQNEDILNALEIEGFENAVEVFCEYVSPVSKLCE